MRVVKCPQCATQVDWASNPHRPFCSERCRIVDLGAWLDEKYTIPGPPADDDGEDGGARAPATRDHDDES